MSPEHCRRAVFLDRDGVLNANVFYADTQAWEAPREVSAFRLAPGVLPALKRLRAAGFLLFVVSNQPNEATGKAAPGTVDAMHELLLSRLTAAGIELCGAFYCRHHPSVGGPCLCRKPLPYFLEQAGSAHRLAMPASWMIGDRHTDMECGRAAGVRTAWVRTGQEIVTPAPGLTDLEGQDLPDVVEQILAG